MMVEVKRNDFLMCSGGGPFKKSVQIDVLYFFFNDTPPPEIYTLSLHDALPIWVERDVGSLHPHPPCPRTEIGTRLRLQQMTQRHRRPVQIRDLVMRTRQGLDPSAQDGGKLLDRIRRVLALRDQSAHETEDVADAVVELGDHQLLPLLRATALARGELRQLQDHF